MIEESITNEWAEFLSYTKEPTYAVRNKKDNGFLGRFTMDMLMENYGFAMDAGVCIYKMTVATTGTTICH